jgi:hypothetical protein
MHGATGNNNAEMVAACTSQWTEGNDMMKHHVRILTSILACATVSPSGVTMAQTSTGSDASGESFTTVPPSDFGFYELLNKLVQKEPNDALDDVERMGQMASIGIVKGKPFEPDAHNAKDTDGRRSGGRGHLAHAGLSATRVRGLCAVS